MQFQRCWCFNFRTALADVEQASTIADSSEKYGGGNCSLEPICFAAIMFHLESPQGTCCTHEPDSNVCLPDAAKSVVAENFTKFDLHI